LSDYEAEKRERQQQSVDIDPSRYMAEGSTKAGGYPFARKEKHYRGHTDDQLQFAHHDALSAATSIRGHDDTANGWYHDDAHTIHKEMQRRGIKPDTKNYNYKELDSDVNVDPSQFMVEGSGGRQSLYRRAEAAKRAHDKSVAKEAPTGTDAEFRARTDPTRKAEAAALIRQRQQRKARPAQGGEVIHHRAQAGVKIPPGREQKVGSGAPQWGAYNQEVAKSAERLKKARGVEVSDVGIDPSRFMAEEGGPYRSGGAPQRANISPSRMSDGGMVPNALQSYEKKDLLPKAVMEKLKAQVGEGIYGMAREDLFRLARERGLLGTEEDIENEGDVIDEAGVKKLYRRREYQDTETMPSIGKKGTTPSTYGTDPNSAQARWKEQSRASRFVGRNIGQEPSRSKQSALELFSQNEKRRSGRDRLRDRIAHYDTKARRGRATGSPFQKEGADFDPRQYMTEAETREAYFARMKRMQAGVDPKKQPILHKLLAPRDNDPKPDKGVEEAAHLGASGNDRSAGSAGLSSAPGPTTAPWIEDEKEKMRRKRHEDTRTEVDKILGIEAGDPRGESWPKLSPSMQHLLGLGEDDLGEGVGPEQWARQKQAWEERDRKEREAREKAAREKTSEPQEEGERSESDKILGIMPGDPRAENWPKLSDEMARLMNLESCGVFRGPRGFDIPESPEVIEEMTVSGGMGGFIGGGMLGGGMTGRTCAMPSYDDSYELPDDPEKRVALLKKMLDKHGLKPPVEKEEQDKPTKPPGQDTSPVVRDGAYTKHPSRWMK